MQSLPVGISEFSELRKENCLYVDKTKYIYSLLTKPENRRTFLSRPRRFGKSLFVSTLEAALQGKKELFKGLWIAESDYSWEPMGVIRLDFSELSIESSQSFKQSFFLILQEIADSYGIAIKDTLDLNSAFRKLIRSLGTKDSFLQKIAQFFRGRQRKTYDSVAILIDEYDYPILHTLHNPILAKEIRDILKSFSCLIKAQAKQVKFVFVTGVSAFSKSGLSSGLNNLMNLTMREDYYNICGYTEEEVDKYFAEHIEAWSDMHNIPCKEIRENLKNWYNGYRFIENTPTVYSPFSLTSSLQTKKLQNF